MSPKALATVIMITWSPDEKRLRIMKKSFESLKKNTLLKHKLVVVDNGPGDTQFEFLKSQKIDKLIRPGVNVGVGNARNLGAECADTPYIAFVDNDFEYFEGWLKASVGCLKRHYRWPVIICPWFNVHFKGRKHFVAEFKNGYRLFNRAACGCLVMRTRDFAILGKWSGGSQPGRNFCSAAARKKFLFMWHPAWRMKHMSPKASYNHRHKLIEGIWTPTPKKSRG